MRLLSHIASVAITLLACLAVHGCANVDGGAVELSWKLRSASGATTDFLQCGDVPGIAQIQLDWEVGPASSAQSWSCGLGHGVTGFDLPQGQALLSVKPVCRGGATATNGYIAPAPELRQVNVGATVSLGAVELVLQVTSCDRQPCVCQ